MPYKRCLLYTSVLQLGDKLTVVGEAAAISNVEKVLGNRIISLKEPNLIAVFVGIVLGLAVGAIPFSIPGVSFPVRLGIAGGPIIVGILMGAASPTTVNLSPNCSTSPGVANNCTPARYIRVILIP